MRASPSPIFAATGGASRPPSRRPTSRCRSSTRPSGALTTDSQTASQRHRSSHCWSPHETPFANLLRGACGRLRFGAVALMDGFVVEGAFVEQVPEQLEPAVGERAQGLVVGLAVGALAVVEVARPVA